MYKKLLVIFLMICSSCALPAIPFLSETPVIDGDLSDGVWKKLPWKDSFSMLGKNEPAAVQTRFKTFNDGKYIYFAVECSEPDPAGLTRGKKSYGSPVLWTNDSIEINLIPDNKLLTFYKCVVDVNGTFTDLFYEDDNTDKNRYLSQPWSSALTVKTKILSDRWTVEVAIPFGTINYSSENNNQWRLNIGRNRWRGGNVELSSWSALPEKNHVMPKYFRVVTVEKFTPDKFSANIESFKGEVVRQNGQSDYRVLTSITNNSPTFRTYQILCTITNTKDGKTYTGKGTLQIPKFGYQNSIVTIPNVPNGNYTLTVDLKNNSRKPVILKRLARNIDIEYLPLQITMIRPAYRNNIYATMPDKTIEACIKLHTLENIPVTVTLSGNGVNEVRKIAKPAGNNKVVFDGSKLPDGKYILKASYCENGKEITASTVIQKLPYRKGEVWLDKRGVVHIDGKEFLSYGWYHVHGVRNPVYNTLVDTIRFKDMEEAENVLRTSYEKFGLKSMIYPFQDLDNYTDWRWVVFKDPDTRKKGLTKQQREKIISFVSKISKHEGLLGYYMADEPEARDHNPLWYEEAYELISQLDPYHPCFMLNYGIDGMRKYYKGCDILFPDCYPQYFEDGSTGSPRWKSTAYAKIATSLRPTWLMPQISQYPEISRDGKLRGIAPTYYDQRSQVFQALIHNVKGISNYTYFDSQRFSDAIIGPPEIGNILLKCAPYFLETTVVDGVGITTAPHSPNFQAGLKVHNGKLCLLAVNTTMQKVKVKFKLNNKFSGKLYLEGARRHVNVVNGMFSDDFAPNETRIYYSDHALAASLTPVEDTVKAIKNLRASRKKPGNLVGRGDMYPVEYRWYGKDKKLAPGVPEITASSESLHVMTLETGSLYYLIDGLTVPNRREYCWAPSVDDKKPFVQFKLSKAENLKMVKLYTSYGNLKAGQIVVNGKVFPFNNKAGKNEITVPLHGIHSDTVRIECTEFRTKNLPDDFFGLSSKVLTEVEIY